MNLKIYEHQHIKTFSFSYRNKHFVIFHAWNNHMATIALIPQYIVLKIYFFVQVWCSVLINQPNMKCLLLDYPPVQNNKIMILLKCFLKTVLLSKYLNNHKVFLIFGKNFEMNTNEHSQLPIKEKSETGIRMQSTFFHFNKTRIFRIMRNF